jgi:DNA-binding PadR family transcriptional regulator
VSLPHVLLGLLRDAPQTGYDLTRAVRERMDPSWSAGFSQIYPVLAGLRRRGWVLLRVLGPRHGPRRNLYRVTAAGRRELARWLAEPPAAPRGNDALLARLALLDGLPAPDRRRALAAAETAISAEAARLRALPMPEAYAGLARRAAIDRHDALRRFLHGLGASASAEPRDRRGGLKKKR